MENVQHMLVSLIILRDIYIFDCFADTFSRIRKGLVEAESRCANYKFTSVDIYIKQRDNRCYIIFTSHSDIVIQ
jgi:hypothetical protein